MKELDITTVWLNITSRCNNNCIFCYSKTKTKDMPLSKVKQYVKFIKELNPKTIILIGGEPTVHKDFITILRYFNKLNIKPSVVSNGLLFSNTNFTKTSLPLIKHLTISIEGTKQMHNKLTQNPKSYDLMLKGIKNCFNFDKTKISTNTTISKTNIQNIPKMVKILYSIGLRKIGFNLCTDFNKNKVSMSPKEIYIKTSKLFLLLKKQFKDVRFNEITPLPKCFIKNKNLTNIYSSGCHIISGSGLIIDVDGHIVPCTHWIDYKLVKLNPLISLMEFKTLWKKLDLFRKAIGTYPVDKCITCKSKESCCGGCPIFWRCYDPRKEINLRKNK